MRGAFAFILFFMLHGYVAAQIYYFRKYNTGSGLIQNTVKAIKQDIPGRLWIGTAEGLSIYDGEEFTNYSQSNGLLNSVINCFYQVNDSILLVGSNGSGVYVFHKPPFGTDTLVQFFSGPEYLINNNVNNILKDWNNDFWFCTDSGVTRWRLLPGTAGVVEVKHFGSNEGFAGKLTHGTTDNKNKILWFGTEVGLIRSDGETFRLEMELPDRWIQTLYADGDSLLIGTSERILIYYDGKLRDFVRTASPSTANTLQHFSTREILKDRKGTYWFATTKGLLRYYGNSLALINHDNGLEEDILYSLTEDREGNLWVGSANGLFKYSDESFAFIPRNEKNPHVFNFSRDDRGTVWASTLSGIYNFDNNRLTYSKINSATAGYTIYNVMFSGSPRDKKIWAATSGGIFRISVDRNGLIQDIKIFGKDELAPAYEYSRCMDKKGNIWVNRKDGELFLISNDRITTLTEREIFNRAILPGDMAVAMFNDSKNSTWLGYFQQGLFRVSGDSVIRFTARQGFTSHTVRSIFEDSRGNIWIGTRYDGVFKYANGRFTAYTTEDGLNSNWVKVITEDNNGTLWFGTAKGVASFNDKVWKVYEESKGIKAGEMIATTVSIDGTVYFSASNGIYFYAPKTESKKIQPHVFIKKFQFIEGSNADYIARKNKKQNFDIARVFGSKSKSDTSYKRKFKFSHKQNGLIFECAAAHFTNEAKTMYTYKLEGFDEDWSKPTRRNYISYANLPAGDYRFLVKAIDSEGIASAQPAAIEFSITPPFWQTWWFRVLVVCLLTGSVAVVTTLINRYHLRRVLEIERMRTEIATDLHDDIGSSLTGISIFSQLVKREIKRGTLVSTELLDKIETSSRTLIDSMNDIVWSINPDNDSLEDVILKLEDFAVKLLEAKNMEAYISIPKELNDITLPMDKRRNLLLIFKEMINNVVKHSHASTVHIGMKLENHGDKDQLRITVKDDGVGFCMSEVKPGNGLKNMRKRCESINGSIHINSIKGKETLYELSVPV